MAGTILQGYEGASALTVTNLHSLPASQDWTAGWASVAKSNLADKFLDYLYSFSFTTHASNRQIGAINLYVIASLSDVPGWPPLGSGSLGSEGLISFVDTEERDSACQQLGSIIVDNSASAVYTFPQRGIAALFGMVCPTYHAIFISHNCSTTTTAGFASSGSVGYRNGVYGVYT
jgi:hypothetical protein